MHQLHRDVSPSKWCITWDDLAVFEREVYELWSKGKIPIDPSSPTGFQTCATIGPTIHQINEHYIKPRTQDAGGMSWALMRNPDGLECDMFVTHCWSEGVFEWISKVRDCWPYGGKHLYCCFLSNPQNADIGAVLGTNPWNSPFAKALGAANYLLVIPNRRVSIYTRLWCVFEAYLAIQYDLQICLPSRPEASAVAWLLVPGVCLMMIAAVLAMISVDHAYSDDSRMYSWADLALIVMLVATPLWVLQGSPTLKISPKISVWSAFTVIGVVGGMYIGERRVTAATILVAGLVCTACHRTIRAVIDQCVKKEKDLLSFETVRRATCSVARDEDVIREAIKGREDMIDEIIGIFKRIGKYDVAIKRNLARGLRPSRVRLGSTPILLGVYVNFWSRGFSCWFITDSWKRDYLSIVCTTMVILIDLLLKQTFVFASDMIIWGGVTLYVCYDAIEYFHTGKSFHWTRNRSTCSAISMKPFIGVWVALFVSVAISIWRFYTITNCDRRNPKRRQLMIDANSPPRSPHGCFMECALDDSEWDDADGDSDGEWSLTSAQGDEGL